MYRYVAIADASDALEGALQRSQTSGCQALPVLRNQQLVGLLTAENLGEFVMIRSARDGRSTPVAEVVEATA
jgi:predicted transcriptional regulator